MNIFLISILLVSRGFAADRLQSLMECVRSLDADSPRILRPTPQSAVISAFVEGWAILAFDKNLSYRCEVPRAIEECFRKNPKCPEFSFLLARPGHGVRLVFNGQNIDDHARTNRLGGLETLEEGTVDEGGRIFKVIRGGPAPVLGLRCVIDRGPHILDALEQVLRTDLAEAGGRPQPASACGTLGRAPGASGSGAQPERSGTESPAVR